MSNGHARLSASKAHRWLRCGPSANYPDTGPSIYAATGAFAHDIAAKCLNDNSISPTDFLGKKGKVDGFDVECDMEMVDAIEIYLDVIAADLQAGDLCWVEMSLQHALGRVDPDLGGTADYVRYRPSKKHLMVRDFKYGSGVYVDADDNEQLKEYALGALLEVTSLGHSVTDITISITQPRFEGAQSTRDHHFKAIELLDFMADVKEAANRSRDPKAPYVAGDHCKFCPAARTCPELERQQRELLAAEFPVIAAEQPAGALVNYAPVAAALASIPAVKERIKAIEEFAYQAALKGAEIPGYKLVEKRATRKWKSEGDVIMWAEKAAIDPYAPREVLSPAQLEKKLAADAPKGKKKEAGKVLEQFVERISSGTALVPVSDERPPAKLVTGADFPALA